MKTLVRELHRARIEVILDVVLQPHGRGQRARPDAVVPRDRQPDLLHARGADPIEPQRYYMNYTGCGNSMNLANPAVIRLVMDSLRYWVEAMHVDGFRFDLASVLGREEGDASAAAASFFDAISQDPVLVDGSSSSPSPGISAPTRSATSPSTGRSGTGASATRCGSSRKGDVGAAP